MRYKIGYECIHHDEGSELGVIPTDTKLRGSPYRVECVKIRKKRKKQIMAKEVRYEMK